ncbi:MAG: hypothetical protein ACKOZT_05315, partial [Cyanobium sp.]
DASIPVDAEADAEDREDFRRFLDRTSPAELIRHLRPEEGVAAEASEPPAEPDEEIPGEAPDASGGPAA